MGGKGTEFEFAGQVAAEQAAEYLDRIAEGIRAGHVGLGAGGERVDLSFGELVKLEVEAESDGRKGNISLDISWKPAEAPAPTLEILSAEASEDEEREEDEESDRKSETASSRRKKPATV